MNEAPDALAVTTEMYKAFGAGDLDRAAALLDPDVVYVNCNFRPFEVRGRDEYMRFITAVDGVYNAPRRATFSGVSPIGTAMAAMHGTVTVGDATIGWAMVHRVVDGAVVEIFDVADDRARAFEPYLRDDAFSQYGA